MSNAQQEEQLKALENQFQVLDNKLKNLESADLFLQEAHRILTEKTTHVESESKKIEENISSQLKDQQEEINTKIKVQVSSLLKDVSELTTDKLNILETLTLIKEKEHGYDEKIKGLEEANIESLKSSNSYVDGLLEGIHEQFKFNIEKIETKIDNNTTLIQENDMNIKSNNENILSLQRDLKLFSNNLDELRSFDVISNIQVLQADRNELKVQIDTVHNDIKTVTDKMNTEFEGLAPQVQKNKDNFNELQKTTETIFLQLSSHFTNIEKLSDDNSSIIDELHNAEEKFTELDGQIVDLKKKLEDIEIKTGETVCKIAEITSLTNNIEVNVKSQELKLEQQKAVDMEVIASQIANLTGQLFQIQAEVGEVAVDRKNFMEHLDVLQTQMNDDKTFYKAESETMRTKVDSYLSILNTLENEFNKLVRESKGNEDSNKVLAKRISDLELLDKKIVQLEEQQQMDRYQLTNHLDEKLMPVNAKLQKTQEDLDKRFETILTTDLANIKGFGELLKKEVEILRTETDARSKKIVELEQETKTLAFRVDTGVTDFNMKQESLADHVSAIATRLELLESDSGEHQQKLISLEEATFVQAEKARYVESLNERFSRMDEIRQQSESKSKEELEHTVASNAKAIEAIKQALGQRIQKLEEDIQGDFTSLKHDMESRIDNSNELMKSNISGDIESRIIAIYSKIEEHRSLIEKTHTSVTFIREKVAQNESQQFGIQESLSKQNENNIEALRRDMHEKIQDLYSTTSEHSNVLSENNINIIQLNENNAVLSGRMAKNEHEINHLKETMDRDRDLVVMKFKEEKDTLESFFKSLAERVEIIQTTQTEESIRLASVTGHLQRQDEQVAGHQERIQDLNRQAQDHRDLIISIEKSLRDQAAETNHELKSYRSTSREEIKNIRADMESDKENLWTLIIEIYSAFRGYTVVLKSEGAVREHQADVLGVYRMVDSYNERPVYKQDGGENYIYYSAASSSWLVGTVVGHQYGWLRNGSAHAGARKWIPDLRSGWEYRPLVRTPGELTDTWRTDDGTLRIESLRDVEKVNEVIRDIKNAKEID